MVIEGRESLCKSRMYSIFVALNAYNGAYNRKNGGIEAPLETTPTCNFLPKDCNIQTSYKCLVRTYVCTKRRILIDESSPSKIIRIFILTRKWFHLLTLVLSLFPLAGSCFFFPSPANLLKRRERREPQIRVSNLCTTVGFLTAFLGWIA